MWGIVIPSVFFSLWHFSPQIAMPQNNRFVFILSTLPLGIVNGIIAFNTKSAKWSAIGHSIGGILAFGGSTALSLYKLLA
jgi:membrane protease YdiL (CAAX protease family)